MAITIQPIAEAVEKLSSKSPVGSTLKSAEWATVPAEIRDRVFFMSRVENAKVVNRAQQGLADILAGSRNEFGVIADRTKFIADLRELATREGLAPKDPALRGTIQDVTSRARAELVLKTQTEMAYNFARHKRGSSPDALRALPAQELVRVIESKEKRRWVDIWRGAGGRTFPGQPSQGGELQPGTAGIRCIALKGDPIWAEISRFGLPYPPFDFNSGVGVANVNRLTALQLGLITLGQTPEVPEPQLNTGLEVDLAGMDPAIQAELLRSLGSLVRLSGSVLKWIGGAT